MQTDYYPIILENSIPLLIDAISIRYTYSEPPIDTFPA